MSRTTTPADQGPAATALSEQFQQRMESIHDPQQAIEDAKQQIEEIQTGGGHGAGLR